MSDECPGAEWTGCVHCGQPLPHVTTDWRDSHRCRLFQRIAEQAWDEGRAAAADASNPYAAVPTGREP